jgi:hypothetical protein
MRCSAERVEASGLDVVNDCRLRSHVPLKAVAMSDFHMLLAAAALLIAAVMLPIPSSVRGILFVLLGGFYLLTGFGMSLRQLGSMFN